MYVRRNIKWNVIFRFAWRNLIKFTVWSTLVVFAYVYFKEQGVAIGIPFLPLSTIGIAVAFYVGFKNSQSYDRFWEGRKIWGGIVNYSRTWANQVLTYMECSPSLDKEQVREIQERLVYRHLGFINALRIQLRMTTIHDRDNLSPVPDFKLANDRDCVENIANYLSREEYNEVVKMVNTATQLNRKQGAELAQLRKEGVINDFQHIDMMKSLEEFYNLQGKCERIKNTPFPRQFAYFSTLFVWIFIILLPFGLVEEFQEIAGGAVVWLAIPFSILISWVFASFETIGDNSEDPFENYVNDVPMSAICRTIEIDLKQMLGETDLPPKLEPVGDVLL